jgi:hypothetical protein
MAVLIALCVHYIRTPAPVDPMDETARQIGRDASTAVLAEMDAEEKEHQQYQQETMTDPDKIAIRPATPRLPMQRKNGTGPMRPSKDTKPSSNNESA